MNHIYKVVWSKVRNCYVAVSEIAKGHGKKSPSEKWGGKKAALLAAVIFTLGIGGTVGAKGPAAIENGPVSNADGIASIAVGVGDKIVSSNTDKNRYQGATSIAVGTLNTIDADADAPFDGAASSVIGQVNYTKNANAAIIMGAGNKVTNSYRDVSGLDEATVMAYYQAGQMDKVTELLQKAVPESGGQVMVMGGGNTVDYAQASQIMGVSNTLKGTKDAVSQYNLVDGFQNNVTNAQNTYVVGTKNKAENTKNTIVIGDNREVKNEDGSVIIGTADSALTTNKKNVTILGNNANVNVEGGVAIGDGSISTVDKGQKGYYIKHDQRIEENEGLPFQQNSSAWISRAGAVSVGDTTNKDQSKWITRQITGVAAGTNDTDAVNVAQLKNSQTKYFSIYDPGDNWLGIFPQIPDWAEKYKNENNQGATNYWGMAAGFGTSTDGLASTVIGSLSRTNSLDGMQGATSVSVGTFNFNLSDPTVNDAINADNPDVHAQTDWGVANSIVGQVNLAKNSNGALIYGAGNVVTNSYRNVDGDGGASGINGLLYGDGDMQSLLSDPEKAIKVVGKLIDSSGGKAMVFGGGNVLDKAYSTQVVGVGNTVTGSDLNFTYQESPEIGKIKDWVEQDAARTADIWNQYEASLRNNGTRLNYVDGYYSTLKNGQNDYMIGTANEVTGDDASKNKSNIVFGDYHKLKNGQNNIIIGSADGSVEEKATPFVDTDEYGKHITTEITGQKQHVENLTDAVIIGHNADVQKNGGVALGSESVAATDKGVVGLDLKGEDHSADTTGTWKSTAAAVSVGNSTGDKRITRQITNVAAGYNDTDAVNVAQLKAAMDNAGSKISLVAGDGIKIEGKDGTYTISANITGGKTATDTTKVDGKTGTSGDSGSTDKGNTDASGNGKQLVVTTDTNPTMFAADEGTAAEVKPSETLTINGDKTNIATKVNGNAISVKLKDDISVKTVNATSVTATDSIGIKDGPSMTTNGIDAAGKKITHVAAGTEATDAVNYGQLKDVESKVDSNSQAITNINSHVNRLDNRINKVGAGAAALAGLHPLDFDPADKWNFAVGYGNYRNANSVAVGAFYRPNGDTMVSVGTNFGNGENMVNAGVSFKLGQGSSYAGVSKAELAEENQKLKANDAAQDQKIQNQEKEIQELKKALEELKSHIK